MTLPSEVFLLDTNVFIEPKGHWYPFDVVPGYWDFLRRELGGECIRSIVHVYEELQGHADALADWVKGVGRKEFEDCAEDPEVFARYLEVASYVQSLEGSAQWQKRRSAIDEFLREGAADPWLVAHASVYGETVVTQEASHPLRLTKVSLVDVCDHFEVRHTEVVPFLRRSMAVFQLRN